MSKLKRTIECPVCKNKSTYDLETMHPGASATCAGCGATFKFQGDDGRDLQQREDQRQRFNYFRNRIVMTLLPFLAIAMFLTNPDEKSLRAMGTADMPQLSEQSGIVAKAVADQFLVTRYTNLRLFSIGGVGWSEHEKLQGYLGLFGHWFRVR